MSSFSAFIIGRLKGCGYAMKGAILLLRTEASIQVQAGIGVLMTILGLYMGITPTEWMLQIFAIGLIMSMEGLNTAIEAIADFVHPDFHNKIGILKDIAAGAVFIAAITAVIIGMIIYIPYFV